LHANRLTEITRVERDVAADTGTDSRCRRLEIAHDLSGAEKKHN
jgi:hypothetical protein